MMTFDAGAMLADLHSPESELHDRSIIVVASTPEFLFDLYDTFVYLN